MSSARARRAARATRVLEALAREQHALAAWLCREYGALTFEDAEDLVAEALSRLNDELPAQLPAARAYLRTMLRRDAIDELRHRQGRRPSEKAMRPRVVPLGELPDGAEPAGPQTADAGLAEHATRTLSQSAVQRALASLPEQERETLRMRYLDELQPAAICRGLGLSRTQYERRLTDGIRHALEALVTDVPLPACRGVRAAIAERPGRLAAEDAARRDAHLEECLACRAFERRARGLLALLPTGPALGWWAQLRLKGEGLLHRGAEAAASTGGGGEAAAGAGGAAAGSVAGGLLAGGAAVKVAAACSSAAAAVVCVAQIGSAPERSLDREPAQAAQRAPEQRPARAPAATPPLPTATAASIAAAGPARSAGERPPRRPSRKTRASAAHTPAPPAPARAASDEFGPEGATSATPPPPTAMAAGGTPSSSAGDAGSSSTPSGRPAAPAGPVGSEFEP